MAQVTLNAHVYSDDGSAARDMLNAGHKVWLVPMLSDNLVEVAKAKAAADSATLSAATATAGAVAMSGTSLTSNTVGTGSKTFATQPGKSFTVDAFLMIASAGAYMIGQVTAYNATTGALTVNVTYVGSITGVFASWNISITGKPGVMGATGSSTILNVIRTTNSSLTLTDKFKFIDCVGTFTLTLDPGVTLGDGWSVIVRNASNGDVTIKPNGSETMDTRLSFPMMDGEVRQIFCDGTSALKSVVLSAFTRTYIVSGVVRIPPGYRRIQGILCSPGGSGRKNSTSLSTGGGGGGACVPFDFDAALMDELSLLTMGSPGAGVTTDATNGNAGGTSRYLTVYVYGGDGGTGATTGGTVTIKGGSAYYPSISSDVNSLYGYASGTSSTTIPWATYYGGVGQLISTGATASPITYTVYGGQSGGGIKENNTLLNVSIANTVFGGIGGASSLASSGGDGAFPSGGGGATRTGARSGNGGGGKLQYWGVI